MRKLSGFVPARVALVFAAALPLGCGSSPTDGTLGSTQEALLVGKGVDYSFARPSPGGLDSEGYKFACRYLSPPPNGKNLSAAEANQLWAAGVDVVANFEEGATNALSGHGQGVTDADVANSQSQGDGIPHGRPIYFSVDFDAQSGDFAAIDSYFDGVASVIGVERTGAYGGIAIIQHLFNANKIRWGWQTYAWSNGAWDGRAQLRQVLNGITAAGDPGCCDEDQAWARDYGQWHSAPADPCASVAVDGYYCGQSPQWTGGTKDHLYDCVGGVTKSDVDCLGGCVVEPSNTNDKCAPYDAGAADARADAHPVLDGGTDSEAADGSVPREDSGPPDLGDAGSSEADGSLPPPGGSGGCSTSGKPAGGGLLGSALMALALLARRRKPLPDPPGVAARHSSQFSP